MATVPQLGTVIAGRTIIEVGQQIAFGISAQLLPVRFGDGMFAILHWSDDVPLNVWTPDAEEADRSIKHSTKMPIVRRGIGSDVVHVSGTDHRGSYLVKLYYNEKKMNGRPDEVYR